MKMYRNRNSKLWHCYVDCPGLRMVDPKSIQQGEVKPESLSKKEICRNCSRRYNSSKKRSRPLYVKEFHYVH